MVAKKTAVPKVTEIKEVKLELDHKNLVQVRKKWTQKDNSVDEVSIINLVQLLTAPERIHFVNELYRVLKVDAKAQIICPHWCSGKAYGDLMVQWPPVSEGWMFHLNKKWREENAPWGTKYKCDFDFTLGYGMHQLLVTRAPEYQQDALTWKKEAAQDLVVTLTKR